MELDGKTVVITGAGRGVGLAATRRIVEAGGRVMLADQDEDLVAAEAESRREAEAQGEAAEASADGGEAPPEPRSPFLDLVESDDPAATN